MKNKIRQLETDSNLQLKTSLAKINRDPESHQKTVCQSNLSLSTYDKIRKDCGLLTKDETLKRKQTETQNQTIKSPVGKFSSYLFDKAALNDELANLVPGSEVNWTELPKKYNLKGPNGNEIVRLLNVQLRVSELTPTTLT